MTSLTHILGDGLDILERQEPGSVSLILADPPWAVTANPWDQPIDLDRWWKAAWMALKPSGTICAFANPPFSGLLCSHPLGIGKFRYDWIWQKERGSNFQHAKRQPMKVHEHVHVFYRKQPTYNPIKTDLNKVLVVKPSVRKKKTEGLVASSAALYHPGGTYIGKYPESILKFSRDRPMVHPSQKPVALLAYFIKTYTNPGDLVFDPFAGYASTTKAVQTLGDRSVVSVELDPYWFAKGRTRLLDSPSVYNVKTDDGKVLHMERKQ